jgi:hypothetical protein
VISETYGVFVAPPAHGGSDATGTGTRDAPYATLANGIAKAGVTGKRVYACGDSYPESLAVGVSVDGARVYGGLRCPVSSDGGVADAGAADASSGPWSYSGTAATVAPASAGYALNVTSLVKGAHFEDMAFTALPATAAAGSSIAVMIMGSSAVSFLRVVATATVALAGVPGGVLPSNACAAPMNGAVGTSSGVGAPGTCTCPVFGSSAGGAGGAATAQGQMAPGGTATPPTTLAFMSNDGAGGLGWYVMTGNPYSASVGNNGANGSAGAGGAAGGSGSLTMAGWSPLAAATGAAGYPGQGGGGGGGNVSLPFGGAGGGMGGCGGNGGGGGGGGGASMAVAIVDSTVSFDTVALQTSAGGNGGPGAPGAIGQAGTSGGPATGVGSANTGAGGTGGQGAGGSGGGGGAGGPSVGIAWTGSTPPTIDGTPTFAVSTLAGVSNFTAGAVGSGGAGGDPGPAAPLDPSNPGQAGNLGTSGAPGSSGAVHRF